MVVAADTASECARNTHSTHRWTSTSDKADMRIPDTHIIAAVGIYVKLSIDTDTTAVHVAGMDEVNIMD